MQSGGRKGTYALAGTYDPSVNSACQKRDETPDTVHSRTSEHHRGTGDRSPPALGNAVAAHLGVERGAPQAEKRGRCLLVPARGLERPHDRESLDLLERAG